jgi:FMN phosphatase YigB (HAD superfamily)
MLSTPRSKVLLLDMDGVILRHPPAFKMLGKRVSHFVRRKVNPFMTEEKAEKINHILYKEFGHTVLGLQKVYDSNISVREFCDMVYDKHFLEYIRNLNKEDDFMNYTVDTQQMMEYATEKGVPIFIFSNANQKWCQAVLDAMDIGDIPPNHIIGCDSEAYQNMKDMCLKPLPITYTKAIQHVYRVLGEKEEKQMIYVDDQMQNLAPIMHNKFWKPVWLNADESKPSLHTKNISTIQDLNGLYGFL